jgi:PAS domain S-box-containing protein
LLVIDFIVPGFRDVVRENIQKDLNGEVSPQTELLMRRLDGTSVIVEGRGVKTLIDGKPAIQVAIRDITERKEKEVALITSEDRYRRLLEQSFDAVVIYKEGKITVANKAALTIAGAHSPQELIGRSIFDFIHPDSRKIVEDRVAVLKKDGTVILPLIREKFLRIDGSIVNVEVMATCFIDKGIPAVQVVFREVSDKKE